MCWDQNWQVHVVFARYASGITSNAPQLVIPKTGRHGTNKRRKKKNKTGACSAHRPCMLKHSHLKFHVCYYSSNLAHRKCFGSIKINKLKERKKEIVAKHFPRMKRDNERSFFLGHIKARLEVSMVRRGYR